MTLGQRARAVQTRQDFAALVDALRLDLQENSAAWVNPDLPSFLEAAGAWNADGYYKNAGLDPSKLSRWRLLADLLMAARIYE